MSRAGATLVVNADDLGMCEATTDGIVRAHLDGVVTSTSLIVTTPALDHAVEALRGCPRLGVGLHFSLSAGRPLTPAERIPLLVDAEGRFATRFSSLLAMLAGRRRDELLQQIDLELAAQLERIASCGIRPDHIDGERHAHLLPGIFELVAAAASRHGIRHVRRIDDVGARYLALRGVWAVLASGGPLKYLVLRALSRRTRDAARRAGLRELRYASLRYTGRMDLVLPRLLSAPPAGATEVAVHPGFPAKGPLDGVANPALAAYLRSEDRRRELDACVAAAGAPGPARLIRFAELDGEGER